MRAAEIELLLPEVMRRTVVADSPMAALVGVMEAMHAPSEAALQEFPLALDPLTTPDRFVDMLATWVDLARLDETPAGRIDRARMRLLVSLAADLSHWRGTPGGLMWILGLATGVEGLNLDEAGPFRARITVPAAAAAAPAAPVAPTPAPEAKP